MIRGVITMGMCLALRSLIGAPPTRSEVIGGLGQTVVRSDTERFTWLLWGDSRVA